MTESTQWWANGELRPRRRRGRVLVVPGDAHGRERARLVLPEDLLELAPVGADEGPKVTPSVIDGSASLALRGRAKPDALLAAVVLLPNELAWHVLSFWPAEAD